MSSTRTQLLSLHCSRVDFIFRRPGQRSDRDQRGRLEHQLRPTKSRLQVHLLTLHLVLSPVDTGTIFLCDLSPRPLRNFGGLKKQLKSLNMAINRKKVGFTGSFL